jgi:penicillin amidase
MVDVTSPFAREVATYFVKAHSENMPIDDKNLMKAVELLTDWDGDHSSSSKAATVFNTSLMHLFENLFADELNLLGDDAYENWLSFPPLSLRSTRFILENSQSSVGDDVTTPGKVETMDEILRKSLVEGVRDIENLIGPDPNIWDWGRLHTLTHRHSIGRESSLLNWLFGFNVGPFATGGSSTTVNNGEYRLSAPFDHINGPSKRRAVDMNDLNNTQIILPTGQSGLPKSVHYSDQAELFNAGQYRTTLFDKEAIRKAGFRKLVLLPKD